jgi:RNA polymerase sigma-70 factor (ECF subfamily)
VKSWLYRIATNACLDILRARPRREIPMDTGEPHDPAQPLPAANPEILWLEPAPASLVGPEASLASRESVQLAFVTALQRLPAMQRAAVLLADVIEWPVAEIAELLDSTPQAINSALRSSAANAAASPRSHACM